MNYFVMDTLHWKSLLGANTILENNRFFASADAMEVNKLEVIEASRWWFFLVFLCCMGYLWLVPKLKG